MKTQDYLAIREGRPLPDPESVSLPPDAYDLLGEYTESTKNQLEELEVAALAYEQGVDRAENAAAVRRILHKIKGESGMVGFTDMERIFHESENAFEELPEPRRADMLLRLKDWVLSVLEKS